MRPKRTPPLRGNVSDPWTVGAVGFGLGVLLGWVLHYSSTMLRHWREYIDSGHAAANRRVRRRRNVPNPWKWQCTECGKRLSDCEWPVGHESQVRRRHHPVEDDPTAADEAGSPDGP